MQHPKKPIALLLLLCVLLPFVRLATREAVPGAQLIFVDIGLAVSVWAVYLWSRARNTSIAVSLIAAIVVGPMINLAINFVVLGVFTSIFVK